MKKLIVLAIVGMMVMAMGLAAHADTNGQWDVTLQVGDQTSNWSGTMYGSAGAANFGCATGAYDPPAPGAPLVNSYDSNGDNKDGAAPATTTSQAMISCFDSGVGKTGKGNGYTVDQRPVGTANNVYNLKLWIDSGNSSITAIRLQGWNMTTSAYDLSKPEHLRIVSLPAGVTFTDYTTGTAVEVANPVGYEFTFLPTANGTSTNTQVKWQFNTGTTLARGSANAIQLQLVPEPGSMLAMLSGLVGLVGYGIRRRK